MKLNLTNNRMLITAGACVAIAVAIGVMLWTSSGSDTSKYYPADLAERGHFDIKTDGGVVTLGNKSTTEAFEARVDLVQGANSSMSISYDLGKDVAPVVENDLVKWKNGVEEVFFKQIPAGSSSSQTIPHASTTQDFRHIPLGHTSLSQFIASYELFSSRQSAVPAITTFVPNEDGYVFYGKRTAETDLINPNEIDYPITRIAADNANIICPVIPVTKDGLVAAFIYYPHIGERKAEFTQAITSALNHILQERGVTTQVQQKADSFFYMDGLQPIALGRIAGDTHHLGFYLFIDSPYDTPLKDHLRQRISLADTIMRPYGSLKDLDPAISPSILEDLISQFASQAKISLNQDSLTQAEADHLQSLEKHQTQKTWTIDAVRANDDTIRNYDRFEFDILLHNQPDSNTFTYQIDTTNLEFIKNDPPTDQAIEDGLVTNADLIGSYTAINQTIKPSAFVKAKEKYQTTQAFTIHRPKVIDANGDWQWAELEIDQEKGELRAVVDEEFLKTANYPVIIDPTFGNSSNDYLSGSGATYLRYNQISISVVEGKAGYLNSITAAVSQSDSSDIECQVAIYDWIDQSLMGYSEEVINATEEFNVITFHFIDPISVLDQQYGLALRCNDGNTDGLNKSFHIVTSLSSGMGYTIGYNFTDPWPDTIGSEEYTDTLNRAIYATYTEELPEEPGGGEGGGRGTSIFGGTDLFGNTTIQ